MTTRILAPSEYARLAGTELEAVWPHLPAGSRVLVVEEGEEIIGCWSLFFLLHAEGLWIAPEHRKRVSVGRRLLRLMRAVAHEFGVRAVNTAAMDANVETMLQSVGAIELPGKHFSMRVTPCQQP